MGYCAPVTDRWNVRSGKYHVCHREGKNGADRAEESHRCEKKDDPDRILTGIRIPLHHGRIIGIVRGILINSHCWCRNRFRDLHLTVHTDPGYHHLYHRRSIGRDHPGFHCRPYGPGSSHTFQIKCSNRQLPALTYFCLLFIRYQKILMNVC